MGTLIVIDGVDASGKQTQSDLLLKRLRNEGRDVRMISFPAYDKPSSTLVKMYLGGDFGAHPSDVNAYATSTFYAVDRFATYRTDWGSDYEKGTIILADRYVSSNLIHQASKIDLPEEKDLFIDWLDDLEHNIYSLPRPDVTIFLDMPPQYGAALMKDRANKADGSEKKDIHENDFAYLKKSYDNALYVAKRCGWKRIFCVENDKIRSLESIHEDIYSVVKEFL